MMMMMFVQIFMLLLLMNLCDSAISYVSDIDYYDLDGGRTTLTLFGLNNDTYPVCFITLFSFSHYWYGVHIFLFFQLLFICLLL